MFTNSSKRNCVYASVTNYEKTLKYKNLIFLLVLFSFGGYCQGTFYFDCKVEANRFSELENLNDVAEKNLKDYVFFLNPQIALTNTESAELIFNKSNLDLLSKNEVRFYIQSNSSYDTLTVLGFSLIYYEKDIKTLFYMLPLITFENNISRSKYVSLTEVPYYSLREHLKDDRKLSYLNLELKINQDFDVLMPSYYLFTCPEVPIYYEPYNESSKLKNRWDAHKFISNSDSIDITYNNFPFPKTIKFTLNSSVHFDSLVEYNKYEWNTNKMSNLKIALKYDNIGLEFKSNKKTKTFWALNDNVQYYLKRNSSFQIATEIYFRSAIRNKLNAIYY